MKKVTVATVGEIEEGAQKYVIVNGKKMYISRVRGEFFASDCSCPCPLSGGMLNRIVDHEGEPCVECDARCYTLAFTLRGGENTRGDDYGIGVYPTYVENDTIFVKI